MAVVKEPVVFQVVGYQDSGKTTLVKNMIERLTARSMSVATMKHHGHGGKPSLIENKDSSKHISAGAFVSLVEGDGRILLQGEKSSWTINEQLGILLSLQPDIILIEGHKNEDFPKVVILRTTEDIELLERLSNIKAVLYWDESLQQEINQFLTVPIFSIKDEQACDWVCTWLTTQCN